MQLPPRPTREDTIKAILDASDRPKRAVPIRNSFIQSRDTDGTPRPGALAALVGRGRTSTIEQYLLLRAWASGGNFDVKRDARVWARALGLSEDEAGRRTVGRNWRILSDLKLVEATRSGREMRATVLREDGSGAAYQHPGEAPREKYVQLDFRYWRDGYHESLTVPGKAVLLIALTLGDWFALPTRRGPAWYGLSRSTLERGFANACRAGALEMQAAFKPAPLSPEGYTRENYYRLLPPFGPSGHIAKSAHPSFSLRPLAPIPAIQADKQRQRNARRKPAASKPRGEGTRSPGARSKSRSRHHKSKV